MNIHICGAHRTGKSSLAFALETHLQDFKFKPTYIFEFLSAKYGIKDIQSLKKLPLMMRLRVQEDILTHIAMINLEENIIIDRTFFDVLAYSIFTGIPETDFGADHRYFLEDFYKTIEKNTIFVLTTPIQIPNDQQNLAKSATWSTQASINNIIKSVIKTHKPKHMIEAPVTSIEERAIYVADAVKKISTFLV